MTVERHYDDEALISFLEAGQSSARRDHHLASCRTCSEALASFEAITEVLGLEAAWDLRDLQTEPVPSTIATLRAFAEQMATEDAAAELFVKELLAGSRETWMPRLQQRPEVRTAGVVRKLIEATDHALDTMPPDAVEITNLAVEIAEGLDPAAYASDSVMKLRGAAWRERAYASFYVGNAKQALEAVRESKQRLVSLQIDEFEGARTSLVEALVLREFDDFAQARSVASLSGKLFSDFGEDRRATSAKLVQAMVAFRARDFRGALAIWRDVEGRMAEDDRERPGLLLNMAQCHRELTDPSAALQYFEEARALFEFHGNRPNGAKARWSVALLLAQQGKFGQALALLEAVRSDFQELGMRGEVTFVSIDQAEMLVQLGRKRDVAVLCRAVLAAHTDVAIASAEAQSTILAYLCEAAEEGRVTVKVVNDVRQRLRYQQRQAAQLFAYLPD
jgi:tetratricopeptide (TPR) repeat protein